MKTILKALGVLAVGCSVLLFASFTFAIAKKVWFPKSGSKAGDASKGHVAVVDVKGVIVSSTSFLKDLKKALDNTSTKAIVIRVDSPGGVVAPSQEMYEAILEADKKIPVVVSMGSVGASGGYYLSLGARSIFANSGTLTASIGVIMELLYMERLFEWARVQPYTLKAGRLKDVGSPNRKMTEEERAYMTAMLTDIHQQFRDEVKKRRKLTQQELDAVADGRVMTGGQAHKAKLVDKLGTIQDALKEARALAKLPETAPAVYPEKNEGIFKSLIFGDEETQSSLSKFASVINRQLQYTTPGYRVLMLAPLAY